MSASLPTTNALTVMAAARILERTSEHPYSTDVSPFAIPRPGGAWAAVASAQLDLAPAHHLGAERVPTVVTFACMPAVPDQPAMPISGVGPVVVCCAQRDAAALHTLVEELQHDGHSAVLVSGLEDDLTPLRAAIRRFRGEGLYVLCRSTHLDREAVERLRELLLGREVPFGRTLTVSGTRTRHVRERIAAGLARIAADRVRRMNRAEPSGASRGKKRHATQVGIPPPSPIRTAPTQQPTASEAAKPHRHTQLGIPLGALAASLRRQPMSSRTRVGPLPLEPVAPEAAVEATDARPHERDITRTAAVALGERAELSLADELEATVVDEDLARDDERDDDQAIVTEADVATFATKPAASPSVPVSVRTGNTVRTAPVPHATTVRTPVVTTNVSALLPTSDCAPALLGVPASPNSDADDWTWTWRWLGAGAGAMLLVVALAASFGPTDTAPPPAPVSDRAPSPVDLAEPEPEEPPGAIPGTLPTVASEALRTREIRALDVLLVSPSELGKMAFDEAEDTCAAFSVRTLSDWRLPEIGELLSLRGAAMIGSGYYWSRTAADTFGDDRLAFWGRRSRVVPRENPSQVVCVRGQVDPTR